MAVHKGALHDERCGYIVQCIVELVLCSMNQYTCKEVVHNSALLMVVVEDFCV